jgi:hypothetical protein
MNEIEELNMKIEKCNDINEKINYIQKLNNIIDKEINSLNNLLDTDLIENTFKIPNKYKKISIEELEELFNKTNDIYEKIIIYNCINYKYNNIMDELFDE